MFPLQHEGLGQLASQRTAGGIDAEALFHDVDGFGDHAGVDELLGDAHILGHGLPSLSLFVEKLREFVAHLEISRIDIRQLLEDVGGATLLSGLDVEPTRNWYCDLPSSPGPAALELGDFSIAASFFWPGRGSSQVAMARMLKPSVRQYSAIWPYFDGLVVLPIRA
jgi:hypothetical protein